MTRRLASNTTDITWLSTYVSTTYVESQMESEFCPKWNNTQAKNGYYSLIIARVLKCFVFQLRHYGDYRVYTVSSYVFLLIEECVWPVLTQDTTYKLHVIEKLVLDTTLS